MTGSGLSSVLHLPAETPPAELVAAWERRRDELAAELVRGGQAKPVKLRLQQQLRSLEDEAGGIAQLRLAAEAGRYLAEAESEAGQAAPSPALLRLCLDKAGAVLERMAEGDERFRLEMRRELIAENSRRPAPAAAPPTAAAPGGRRAVLEMSPLGPGGSPPQPGAIVRIVAGPVFTLGRGAAADFPARFWPETPENQQKTSTISRINTTAFLRAGEICIQDGQIDPTGGFRSSRNGTTIDDCRIGSAVAMSFKQERRLKLGQFSYELSARHLGAAPDLENPLGCIRFQSMPSSGARILGIWLLSEASVGSSPDSALVLAPNHPAHAARFLWREQTFWLEVPDGSKGVLTLDGRRRVPGEAVALQAAHELCLGGCGFTVRLA